MSNAIKKKINADLKNGAPYRWVWCWRYPDGHTITTFDRNMGFYEAKEKAEQEQCFGLGYQYVPDQIQPYKVSMVFPARWIVNYTIRKIDNKHILYRKIRQSDGSTQLENVTELFGQFPQCLHSIRATEVKVCCID